VRRRADRLMLFVDSGVPIGVPVTRSTSVILELARSYSAARSGPQLRRPEQLKSIWVRLHTDLLNTLWELIIRRVRIPEGPFGGSEQTKAPLNFEGRLVYVACLLGLGDPLPMPAELEATHPCQARGEQSHRRRLRSDRHRIV
jgi:hypothetical protein